MNLKRLVVAAGTALGLLAAPAEAAITTVVDSFATFPTYNNIGVKAYYTGDDDSDAVVIATIKLNGAATVDTLPPFVRMHWGGTPRKYWASSALWCGSDSTYTITVTVTDPDGTTNGSSGALSVTTWAPPNISVPGKQIWMGPFGADANSGLTSAAPKVTFAGALAAMTTAGDQLRLLPGTYYAMRTDSLLVPANTKNGTATARYSIVGNAGVIISGADTTGLVGASWGSKDIGGVTAFCKVFSPAIWPRTVVLDDSLRLYPYNTFYKLKTDPQGVVSQFGAFWVTADGDSVFVRLPASLGGVVSGHTVYVARRASAIRIQGHAWRVDSLTFRDFGNGHNQTSTSITEPVISVTGKNQLVQNCTFMNNGRPAIGVRTLSDGTQLTTQWATIQKNRFITNTIGESWNGPTNNFVGVLRSVSAACPAADTSCYYLNITYPVLIIEIGRGHVIRRNDFRGGADGAARWASAAVDTAQGAITDCDFYQNNIINIASDCIEPDTWSGVNCRVYWNTALGGEAGLNLSMLRGPMYFVFNTLVNHIRGVLPVGQGGGGYTLDHNRGYLFCVNNTLLSRRSDGIGAWTQAQNGTQSCYMNYTLKNNLMASLAGHLVYESGVLQKNTFNYNAGHVPGGNTRTLTNYSSVRTQLTVQAWQDSSYGYGVNDVALTTLAFSDSAKWKWNPVRTSQVVGAGQRIAGINASVIGHGIATAPGQRLYPWPYMGSLKPVSAVDARRIRWWYRLFSY